jgi:hypothetical protein
MSGLSVGESNSGNTGVEIGSLVAVSTSFIDFHSSGTGSDYDARISCSGGNASYGQGTMTVYAAKTIFANTVTMNAGASVVGSLYANEFRCSSTSNFVRSASDSAGNYVSVSWESGYALLWLKSAGTKANQFIGIQDSSNKVIFRQATNETGSYVDRDIYHTGNTTKASDGTLKAASPIVQLFNDGSYQLNDESAGCMVSRLSVGEYLIEGCTGLNADAAWSGVDGGFDIPIDRNKQPLIWLDYEVNADGSVLVKTYHRTYPAAPAFARNEIEGLADGDPVDIPVDQYVSVRVEMPDTSAFNIRMLSTIS